MESYEILLGILFTYKSAIIERLFAYDNQTFSRFPLAEDKMERTFILHNCGKINTLLGLVHPTKGTGKIIYVSKSQVCQWHQPEFLTSLKIIHPSFPKTVSIVFWSGKVTTGYCLYFTTGKNRGENKHISSCRKLLKFPLLLFTRNKYRWVRNECDKFFINLKLINFKTHQSWLFFNKKGKNHKQLPV